MLYHNIVKKLIEKNFDHVNNHRWDSLTKDLAENIHHRFAGRHCLGEERHDKQTLLLWFHRLGRVFPNLKLKINNIWVKGFPWHTTIFVQWDATTTLENGDNSYFNHGLHIITMKWGKVYSIDVFEDSQEVSRGLLVQAESGIKEAIADPIVS